MKNHLNSVAHDYLRYANCWEDADVLLAGLDIESGDRVLSIGSAGDNCFSLLIGDPEIVVAVDINSVQLKLIELKKASFATLTHPQFLKFLGFVPCDYRDELYKIVREELSEETALYWDRSIEDVINGIIHAGKFEQYFKKFRMVMMPFIHSGKTIDRLFSKKSDKEQKAFFKTRWNSLRWRTLFKVFFSKFIMGRLGRDPEFLNEVTVSVPSFILEKASSQLSHIDCQENYFLEYILKGVFTIGLPHYARLENFLAIKNNLSKLKLYHGYAEEAQEYYGAFNKFNLSNIFEYMDCDTFTKTVNGLLDMGADGARYAYWNLMVPRNMCHVDHVITSRPALLYGVKDRGFFYSKFHVNQKLNATSCISAEQPIFKDNTYCTSPVC